MSQTMASIDEPLGAGEPAERPVTVVVGYDGSPAADAALRHAAARAGRDGRVYAVYVTPVPSEWLGDTSWRRVVETDTEDAQAVLTSARAVDVGHTPIELVHLEGDPAATLVEAAAFRDAAEIVVGSRRHGRLRSALGSTSHALLREADRPVVVVPAGG